MANSFKRFLSIALSVLMVVAMFPVSVLAVENEETAVDVQDLPNATVSVLDPLTLTEEEHDYMVWPSGDSTVDRPLQIVMNFKANETLEEAKAGAYGKYICDFYLTLEGLENGSITAEDCYLAGNYGSFGWIVIPTDGTVLEEGISYPVVSAYDANLTYEDICGSVKDFIAAIHISDDILTANPNFKVTLELKMKNPENAEEIFTIGEPAVYTVADLEAGNAYLKAYDEVKSEQVKNIDTVNGETKIDAEANAESIKTALSVATLDGVTTEIVISFVSMDYEGGETPNKVSFDVSPMATVGEKSVKVTNLDEPVTFRLPVAAAEKYAKANVYHGDELLGVYDIKTDANGNKYVEVSSASFSIYTVEPVYVDPAEGMYAKVGENYYATLEEAVAEAADGATVELLKDETGKGIVIKKNLTIDFGGHTYTVNYGVGSEGTETLGFQLLAGSKAQPFDVTLKNGKIAVATELAEGSKDIFVVIMNYSNLTLEDMVVDGTGNPDPDMCAISTNNGEAVITGATGVLVAEGCYGAIDVDGSQDYYGAASLKINTTGTITGDVVIYGNEAETTVEAGTFDGEFTVYEDAAEAVSVTGGSFTDEAVKTYVEEGKTVTVNGEEYTNTVAPTVTEVATYDELVKALADENVTEILLTTDITAPDKATLTIVGKTLDLGSKTLTLNGESGILENSTIKNGTIEITTYEGDTVADGMFDVYGESVVDDVKFHSDKFALYAIFDLKTGTLVMNECDIDMANNTVGGNGGLIFFNGGEKLTMNDCTVVGTDIGDFISNGVVEMNNCSVTLTGTVENGLDNGINGAALTLNNTNVTIDGATGRGITTDGDDIAINGTSNVILTNCAEGGIRYKASANITVENTASFSATVKVDSAAKEAKINDTPVEVTGEELPVATVTNGTVTVALPWDGVTIDSKEDLFAFAAAVNAGDTYAGKTVTLTATIDLNNEEWTPIGTADAPFKGTFDGGNYTIKNLKITKTLTNSAENNGIGLFGRTDSPAVIEDLTIENVDITGSLYVGAIVGYGYTGKSIENCTVKGDIAIDAWWYAGGIGGNGYMNLVDNCRVIGNDGSYIKGNDGSYIGGIWGFRGEGNNKITNCTVTNIDITGVDRVGGICGIGHYGNEISGCGADEVTIQATDPEATTVGLIVGACQGTASEPTVFEDNTTTDTTAKVGDTVVESLYGTNIDGTTPVTNYVAEVNGEPFATLEAAFAAAGEGDTVTLLKDVTLTEKIVVEQNITIDLKDKTITGADKAIALEITADVTVKNGIVTGCITTSTNGVIKVTSGSLILDEVVLTNTGTSYTNRALRVQTGASAKLTDCTVTGFISGLGTTEIISGTYHRIGDSGDSIDGVGIAVSGGTFHYELSETDCADGLIPQDNGDGTWTVAEKADVAEVNGTAYKSIEAAVAAAGEGDTIILLDDVYISETVKIESGKKLTLDLNGKVIDGREKVNIAIMTYGDLTIKDSSAEQTGAVKAGKTVADGKHSGNTINVCAGTFTLESGTIYSINNAILIDEEEAIVDINGGKITAEPTTNNSAVFYVSSTSNTVINITDGQMVGYNGALLWNNTTVNMSGGSIDAQGRLGIQTNGANDNTEINISSDASVSGKVAAIYHPSAGDLTISENAVLTGETGIILKGGNLTVSGGTISGTGEKVAYSPVSSGFNSTGDALYVEHYDNSTNSENYGTPTVTVTGGKFTSVNGSAVASYANPNNAVEPLTDFVSGGTFNTEVEEDLLEEGFVLTETEGGYGVVVDPAYGKVAKIGDVYYKTIDEALAAVTEGVTLELLDDVTISSKINVTADLTIDGNGHTLTYTGADRAIDVSNTAEGVSLTVKNLTIDFTSGYSQRGINYNTTGELVLDNVTINGEDVTYAVNLPGSAVGAQVTITNSDITGKIALNVWGKDAEINVTDTDLTSVDNASHENYAAVKLNNDGTTAAEGAVINITCGSITALDENGDLSRAVTNSTITGEIIVSDTTVVTGDIVENVAIVKYGDAAEFYSFTTVQDAIDKAAEETVRTATVVLIRDVVLGDGEYLTIAKGTEVVIDLNGKTISGTDTTTKNFGLIQNNGTLTLEDSVGGGKLVLTATVDSGTSRYSAVISNNPGGTLVVNGGTLEHLGGTYMAYGIDSLTNGGIGDVSVTINGGTVKSTYRGIRQFLNSDSKENVLVINGGTVEGANRAVFFHDPSTKANNGSITIEEAATINGSVYLFVTSGSKEWPVDVSINNDVDVEGANIPDGYIIEEVNGVYTVNKYAAYIKSGRTTYYYETLEEAIADAQAGETIKLIVDVELEAPITVESDKEITLDLNGKTLSYESDVLGEAMITVRGDLTVDGDGTIAYTYTGAGDASYGNGNYTVANYGKFTLESGTIANNTAEMSHACYAVDNHAAELIVNGGKIVNEFNYAVRQFGAGDITVNDGVIEGTRAIWIQVPGADTAVAPEINVTVNGGTLSGTKIDSSDNQLAVYSYSYGNNMKNVTIDITGGTFNGDVALTGGKNKTDIETVNISGGTFNGRWGDVYSYGADAKAVENITITGGTFATDAAAMYAEDNGFTLEANAEGKYEVVELDPVAAVDGKLYTTLAAAVAAAEDGGTITLIRDVELTETIVVDKELTIEGSKKISHSGSTVALKVTANGDLTLAKGLTVESENCPVYVTEGGVLTTAANLTATGKYGAIQTSGNYSATVTVNGGVISSVNTISAIYWPSEGTLTVNGGDITGGTAIYIKSGNLVVNGGRLYGTGNEEIGENGSGSTGTGPAVIIYNVANAGYEAIGTVEINGGVFKSDNFAAIVSEAEGEAEAVTGFVNGGTFYGTAAPAAETAAEGYIYEEKNGAYGLVEAPVEAVALVGTEVYTDLQSAIDAAEAVEGTVVLLKDVEISTMLTVDGKATLYLNGHNITAAEGWSSSNGNDSLIGVKYGGDLTIEGNGSVDVGDSAAYSAVKMTITGETDAGTPAKLTVNGGKLVGKWYGITGNGGRGNTEITVNGGEITSYGGASSFEEGGNAGYGIFNPQEGTVTVNGGKISGLAGIEMRAGTLVVNGGEIEATGEFTEKASGNLSGSTVRGAAVAVSQHQTEHDIDVTINGGTLTGEKALYEVELQDSPTTVTMSVTGGTFNGAVESQNVTAFITGGTFNAIPAEALIAEGFEAVEADESGMYTVEEEDAEITVTEDGYETDDASDENVVATIKGTNRYFTTVKLALKEAGKLGGEQEVTLLKEVTGEIAEEDLLVPAGVTLNIGAYNLEAMYIIGVKGSYITNAASGTAGARLLVAQENLIMSDSTDPYYRTADDRYVLPVWDTDAGNYVFGNFKINDANNNRGIRYLEDGSLEFQFKHATNGTINDLFEDEFGSDNNGVSFEVMVTWDTDTGKAYQNFIFKADFTKTVAAGGYDFLFTLANYAELKNLTVTAVVITDSGARISGQTFEII